MANVNITEQVHRVTVQEDGSVHVASVGIQGPPGPQGPPGDADMSDVDAHMVATTDVHGIADSAELATLTDLANVEIDTSIYDDHLLSTEDVHGIPDTAVLETQSGAQSKADDAVTAHDAPTGVHGVGASTVASADDVSAAQDHADSAVSDHNTATNVHGVDTTQLATQSDVDAVLPDPTVDGEVLTLADGSPTWAAPEGGGGLDPDGAETITGDWLFSHQPLRVGTGNSLAIGISSVTGFGGVSVGPDAKGGLGSTIVGRRAEYNGSTVGTDPGVSIGQSAGANSIGTATVLIGFRSGSGNNGSHVVAIGRGSGRNNTRNDRLIIHTDTDGSGNLIDPLIDGRFRDGTDPDSFEYSKGLKVNGHLEATDQLILRSPDGTRWAVTVDDSGNLSTSLATEEITP